MNKLFHIPTRLKAFGYALNGLRALWREPHIKLHCIAGIVAIVAGCIKTLDHLHWIAIFIAISLVWIAEALNTAIEKLCDFACNHQLSPAIKKIKDISAAAVLLAAILSVSIAIFTFIF
ncbi:MAG: diacylglycerol kinase family protein [Taibaiella sp.]|nr:diacylglycerol kinase family protein [Taibaiella sp.]